jgi:hypothetical protein
MKKRNASQTDREAYAIRKLGRLAQTAEPAFSKGSLIQGSGVTLSGTLGGRLVGAGDITINAAGGGGNTYFPGGW